MAILHSEFNILTLINLTDFVSVCCRSQVETITPNYFSLKCIQIFTYISFNTLQLYFSLIDNSSHTLIYTEC